MCIIKSVSSWNSNQNNVGSSAGFWPFWVVYLIVVDVVVVVHDRRISLEMIFSSAVRALGLISLLENLNSVAVRSYEDAEVNRPPPQSLPVTDDDHNNDDDDEAKTDTTQYYSRSKFQLF